MRNDANKSRVAALLGALVLGLLVAGVVQPVGAASIAFADLNSSTPKTTFSVAPDDDFEIDIIGVDFDTQTLSGGEFFIEYDRSLLTIRSVTIDQRWGYLPSVGDDEDEDGRWGLVGFDYERDFDASSAGADAWSAVGFYLYATLPGSGDFRIGSTMRINLDAVYVLTRALLPLLRRSHSAAIVNVASTAAQRGEAEHSHYAASKGALVSWTKSLAVELAPHIRVNAVAPGWVETDMVFRELEDPARRREIEGSIPRGRIATPEEIAGPIAFLASDLAVHVTGEVLNVNGGSVLCV